MINKLLEAAINNNIELEIVNNIVKEVDMVFYNKEIEKYQNSDVSKYRIKAIYNNKTIKIETETIDDIDKIIEIIKEQSKIIDNDYKDTLAEYKELICINSFNEPNYDEIKKDILNLYEFKNKYPSLVSITSDVLYEENTIKLYNTNKTKLEDNNYMMLFYFEIVMDFNGVTKTNYKYYYTKEYNNNDNIKLVEQLILETITKEDANSINTNKYNIILDSICVSEILLHFSDIYRAESIKKNISILSSQFNKKVFSDKITIVEDPQNNKFIGKRLFDDEGTETKFKEIIKNGVFINKLYDSKSSLIEDTVSSGNSFGVRNMYIVPGNNSKDDLIKNLNNGIYINNITGLHAGINDITGDISLQAEGYIIENSKRTKSLNMIILSSNLFELFNNVLEVGNDLVIRSVKGGAPSLLLHDIVIAGKI